MNDIIIRAEHLTKIYKIFENNVDRLKETFHPFHKRYSRDFYALNDLNFEIRRGENIGLVGKNGAGKSTLLKIITGVLTPTAGTVEVNGKIASLLELGAGFNLDMTGVENIYMSGMFMGHTREVMDTKVDDIISFADIGEFIHQPVKTYSSGMFARLAFAVNAFVEPDILIIDEALSVGDAFFQSKCMDKMRSMIESGVTVLFVSHDTFAVKNLCERAFLIDAGKILMDSSANEVIEEYRNMMIDARRNPEDEITDSIKAMIEEVKKIPPLEEENEFDSPIDEKKIYMNKEIFEKNASYQRNQNGKANFENVQLLNLKGEIINEVIFGQEVILRAVIKFNRDVDIIGMGYHIRNNTGIDLVYGDQRFQEEKGIFNAKKNEIYAMDWKFKVELCQGPYTIATVISIPMEKTLSYPDTCDFVPVALNFNVVSPNPYLSLDGGFVHWHNDLKIQKLEGTK